MKCPFCSAELEEKDQNFCQFCGANLAEALGLERTESNQQNSTPHKPITFNSSPQQHSDFPLETDELFQTAHQSFMPSESETEIINQGRSNAKKCLVFGLLSVLLSVIGLISGGLLGMINLTNTFNYSDTGEFIIDPLIGTSLLIVPLIMNIIGFIFGIMGKIYNRRSAKFGYYGKSYRTAGSILAVFGIVFGLIGIVAAGFWIFYLSRYAIHPPPPIEYD